MLKYLRLLSSTVHFQFLIGARDPTYFFMTILLPAGIYAFFGLPESTEDYIASFLVCSFSAFAYFGVFFFQHSIAVAQQRHSPWQLYLSTLPRPPGLTLLAQWVSAVLFGSLSCLCIYGIARLWTPSSMTGLELLHLMFRLSLGGIPLLLFAELCGSFASARAIVPIANFFYLSLSFLGGLWKPQELLPDLLQDLCLYLPTYHYGRLGWALISDDHPIEWQNIVVLCTFALFCFAGLWLSSRRQCARLEAC